MRFHLYLLSTLTAILLINNGVAGQVTTGINAFGAYDTRGADSINLGNLNSHISIPVLHKAGRGIPFTYDLNYDSSVWYPSSITGSNVWTPVSLWGWKGNTDAITGFITYVYSTDTEPDFGGPEAPEGGTLATCTTANYTNWTYYDNFGTTHQFNGQTSRLIAGDPDSCGTGTSSFTETASDGSGFTMNVIFVLNASVSTAHGQQLSPPVGASGAGTFVDQNGNEISVDSSGNFKDTTGNTVLTATGNAPSAKVLTYRDTSGNPQTVTVSYASYTVKTNFGCTGIAEYPATATSLVSRVTLADGSYYAFGYEPTPGTSSDVTGRVASIQLPGGGIIQYAYTGANNGITCADGSAGGITRTTTATSVSAASRVTYTRSSAGVGLSHTEVTDGLNNVSEYDFVLPGNVPNGSSALYYPTKVSSYQGAASGTPLVSKQNCYNSNTMPCTTTSFSLPISNLIVYSNLNGLQQQSTNIAFDAYSGMATYTITSDFGNSSPGNPILRHDIGLQELANGASVIQQDAWLDPAASGGAETFRLTDYYYDETGVQTSSGVPSHVAVSGARGNVTSTLYSINNSNVYHYTAAYEDTGSVVSVSDPVNGTTTFGYDSSFVYQTSSAPPTPPSGANLSSSVQYDTMNTGLTTSVSDPNATTYIHSYDSRLRPTEIDFPDGGATTYTYTPTQISQHRTMSAGSADTETFLDGYGRTSRTAIASASGWYLQDSCYDANGNLSFRSYPYQSSNYSGASVCSGAGDTYSYDALGHTLRVSHASSPATQASYQYSGRTIQSVDENGITKLTQVDGLGRISAVCEITSVTLPNSGAPASCGMDIAGTGYLTTYTYSLVNNQTTITQGGQQRIFQTDWLGRPTSVQEPESGTTTYSYSQNSTGLVVTRVRPRANQTNPTVTTTTTTQYDNAGRVVSITYTDGTPTKTYSYDQSAATAGGNPSLGYSKGRMTSFSTGGTTGFYGYDTMGRINLSATCQPANCSTGTYTTQAYTYDMVGNLLTAGDGTGRTLGYTYSVASEPLTVTNTPASGTATTLVSAAQYGPFGPTNMTLGNGLATVNGYDALGELNAKWLCSGSTSANCSGGSQTYGMSVSWTGGRLSASWDSVLNQQLSYGYDGMNRLASQTVVAGATQNFTYSYDRWGNRVNQIALQTGPSVTTSFNASNNQISSVLGVGSYTYDAAGNVRSDGTYTYSYDGEGNMIGVISVASYTYDALNRRVETITSAGTQQFVFHPGGQRSATLDGAGNVIESESYVGTRPLAFFKRGAFHYQHQDWIGTERMRTTATGAVEGTFSSLPFGDYASSTGTDGDPSHYTGLDHDAETNTEHTPFRQYASMTGTWMRPDPYLGSYDQSNPQSFNRYAYVLNNPLSQRDPYGLVACFYGGVDDTIQNDTDASDYEDVGSDAECLSNGGQVISAGSTDTVVANNDGSEIDIFQSDGLFVIPTLAPSKPNCPANGGTIANVSVTSATPGTLLGSAIGSLFGPEGTAVGAVIGSSFGIGLSVSYVPSTNSWYAGWTAVASPANGGGVSASYSFVPKGQNPNSIANGTSYSVSSTTPFGPIVTKSPGSGPAVVGIAVGTHTPIAVSAGHSWCVHNCGC